MSENKDYSQCLAGKIKISGILRLLTGMHIGASNDFSTIGAVDSIVVRDPVTKRPVIPGSSIKGKMRHLLSRAHPEGPFLEIKNEPDDMMRLFGGTPEGGGRDTMIVARLQFIDLFMSEASAGRLGKMNTDLYLSEIKFENTISRITGEANPRQMERVPAGAEFDFNLIYNIENIDEVESDFKNLAAAISLLHMDYLGGGGTRGNGRVHIKDIKLEPFFFSMVAREGEVGSDIRELIEMDVLLDILKGTEQYVLLCV